MLPNPGAAVYGTIAVGVLLAAESAGLETYADTVGAVAIALVVYWLAHAYSEFAAHRLEHEEPFTVHGAVRMLVRALMLMVGGAIPLLVLFGCWVSGVRLQSGVIAAMWTAVAMIVVVEVVAGRRADLSGWALVGQAAVGGVFGLLIIALRLVLH